MNFSKSTLNILKNYSMINGGIIFPQYDAIENEDGTVDESQYISITTPTQTIISIATIPEKFERKFAIYDLKQFLSVLSLFDEEPEIELKDQYLLIKSGKKKIKYVYAQEQTIPRAPRKLTLKDPNVTSKLEWSVLEQAKKTCHALALDAIVFKRKDGKDTILVENTRNNSSHSVELNVSFESDYDEFHFVVKEENLKIMPFDYDLSIFYLEGNRIFLKLSNEENMIEYYISMNSEFTQQPR